MTAAQKANRERFKKVQAEAKKLKAKNKKLSHLEAVKQAWAIVLKTGKNKKIAAVKIIQKNEKKNAKVTKVLQQTRTKKGLFKGYKKVAGSTHKDTKSHNVNIRVMSGINKEIEYWTNFYGRLSSNLIMAKTNQEKNFIRKQIKILKDVLQKLKKLNNNVV